MKSQFFRTMIIIGLFSTSNLLSAWNVLYSSNANPGKGNCQNICRNVNNNGSVTASVWVENGVSPIVSEIKLLEVDDNGDLTSQNLIKIAFPINSIDVRRIELHRLVINKDSNSYLLLGTAHNPLSSFPITRSFLIKIDILLNVTQLIFLDEHFNYYDFTVTPNTGQIVCVGTFGIFNRLKATSRRAVITTLNNNLTCQGLNLMPQSFPLAGNISRFDNIKVVKSQFDGFTNKEYLYISGHVTRDSIMGSDTFYYPQLFASKIELGSTGSLTNIWFSKIDTKLWGLKYLDEVVPCDLIWDKNRNQIAILNSSTKLGGSVNSLTAHLCLLESTTGNPLNFYTVEGPGLKHDTISLHTFFGSTIQLKSSGKYCINGWANNYALDSIKYGKYNFYQLDFDPQTSMFDSLRLILGRSSSFFGIQNYDFYGLFTDTGYRFGLLFETLGVYYTPHSMLVYCDTNGIDQEVVVWVSTGTIDGNHELRVWSSNLGNGPVDDICVGRPIEVHYDTTLFDVINIPTTWQFVPCVEFFPGLANPVSNTFEKKNCDGVYD